MADIEKAKREFQRIKSLGYVLSDKPFAKKNDGAIGNTFETLLGVEENNLRDADFEGWECKSQRKHTNSASSLFTRKPDYPHGGDEYMRENWGIKDTEFPNLKVFRTSIYYHRWSMVYNKYKMRLRINEPNERLEIILCDLDENIIDESVYWSFKSLKEASSKLKNTFVVKAEEKTINEKVYFKYIEGTVYMNFNFGNLIKLIKDGKARYDNRLGVYRTGDKRGKKHNHGGGIRLVSSDSYKDLFDDYESL
ncbi:MvaI/BcnI restriction endonuclease family protein [SAR86 cluster bacterium]|nr:MvaI/BcnI restriction endonuclease family protein [SAR86 cluster bacterium]